MGATELQIFVSVVVVLGAAFVALICDFLKGSNERLREANLELQVRQDHSSVRTAPGVQSVAAHDSVPAAAETGQAPSRRMSVAHRHARAGTVAAGPETGAGSRRQKRRSRAKGGTAQQEGWTRELVERQIPLPAGSPVAVAEATAPAAPPVAAQPSGPAPVAPAFAVAPGAAEPASAGLTPLEGAAAVAPAITAETGAVEAPVAVAPAPAAPALQLRVEAPSTLEREPAMAGLAGLETPACRLASRLPLLAQATALFRLSGAQAGARPSSAGAVEVELQFAGIAALPGPLPVLGQISAATIPVRAMRPEAAPRIPAATDAPTTTPPMAPSARLAVGLPALHESLAQAAAEPAAAVAGVPNLPRLALEEPVLSPTVAGLSAILAGLPLHGKGRDGVTATPVFAAGSPVAPASPAPAVRELEPGIARTFAECGPGPAVRGGADRAADRAMAPLAPLGFGASLAVPTLGFALASALPEAPAAIVPAAVEPAEFTPAEFTPAAIAPVDAPGIEEMDAPVVRIRVLREDSLIAPEAPATEPEPVIAAGFTQLQDLFARPVEAEEPVAPMQAGLVEQPMAALDSQSGLLPPVEKPAPAPAWSTEPAIPRDKVVELPLHPPTTQSVRAMPTAALLDVPRGWHDARALQQLTAATLPFEGLVACVSITDYARLVQEYGAGRCEEAFNSLGLALETLVDGPGFLCRASEEEIVILFPKLPVPEHSARVRLLAEVLWDFQLRTLAMVPVLCGWGAAEALREPLAGPLARARAQMSESQRFRKGSTTLFGRFRRRVVNG